jgi:hypothetical protein
MAEAATARAVRTRLSREAISVRLGESLGDRRALESLPEAELSGGKVLPHGFLARYRYEDATFTASGRVRERESERLVLVRLRKESVWLSRGTALEVASDAFSAWIDGGAASWVGWACASAFEVWRGAGTRVPQELVTAVGRELVRDLSGKME